MCAIFGWINEKGFDSAEIESARQALKSMRHRGPDASGEWLLANIFLGHNRLSIIDLSPEANQPFEDETGRYVIVLNGEVYNYVELRAELEGLGVRFRTRSDTEVVLQCFIYYGEAAFLKLDGMFAFALFDRAQQKTWLVRDFLGQKPLYYHHTPTQFLFASELRALLTLKKFSWRLDQENIARFLLHSCFMGETTPLVGVKKLLPGHCLVYDGKEMQIRKFWNSVPGDTTTGISDSEALGQFESAFRASCRISMRSDVPYGVFLSGGVDSALILDGCHQHNRNVRAFTVQMGARDFDESAKSRVVCAHLGMPEATTYLMDEKAVVAHIDEHLDFMDEPHGDPGFVNAAFLARACCGDIKVALAGDGADELFAGYIPFQIMGQGAFLDQFGRDFVAFLQNGIERVIPSSDHYMGLQFKMSSFLSGFPADPLLRLPLWLGACPVEYVARLCPSVAHDFFTRQGEPGTLLGNIRELLSPVQGGSPVDAGAYYYQKFFLPEFVCMHTDRAAMRYGLEVRAPFLSRELIELANRMPVRLKKRAGQLKWILRESLRQKKYPTVISDQKKQGFTFPVARWMKSALQSRMSAAFESERRMFSIIDRLSVTKLWQEHSCGQRNHYRVLFNLFVLSCWMEKYSDLH